MNRLVPVIMVLSVFFSHCYSASKHYVNGLPQYDPGEKVVVFEEGEEAQFESGEPYWIVDKPGHYFFSLIAKLFLWNWSFANHDIKEERKGWLKQYFKDNNLTGVKVRFNQYAPFAEFGRLIDNERIHWSMKYTFGLFSWVVYTVFPERLFAGLIGGDHYNQFTNTLNVYSDSVPVLLHEGGHAKDFEGRSWRSGYALFRLVPIAGTLYQEAVASDDAVVYIRSRCDKELELDAYSELSPAYGTYMFSGLLSGIYGMAGVIPGHGYAWFKKRKEREQEIPNCKALDTNGRHTDSGDHTEKDGR